MSRADIYTDRSWFRLETVDLADPKFDLEKIWLDYFEFHEVGVGDIFHPFRPYLVKSGWQRDEEDDVSIEDWWKIIFAGAMAGFLDPAETPVGHSCNNPVIFSSSFMMKRLK